MSVRVLLTPLLAALFLIALPLASSALAGAADVRAALVVQEPAGTWRFEVTVESKDAGWNAYADRWEVLAPDGTVLATRELLHPHVDEQPFTRDLSGVTIPSGIDRVTVRAHHSAAGYDGETMTLSLPGR